MCHRFKLQSGHRTWPCGRNVTRRGSAQMCVCVVDWGYCCSHWNLFALKSLLGRSWRDNPHPTSATVIFILSLPPSRVLHALLNLNKRTSQLSEWEIRPDKVERYTYDKYPFSFSYSFPTPQCRLRPNSFRLSKGKKKRSFLGAKDFHPMMRVVVVAQGRRKPKNSKRLHKW